MIRPIDAAINVDRGELVRMGAAMGRVAIVPEDAVHHAKGAMLGFTRIGIERLAKVSRPRNFWH